MEQLKDRIVGKLTNSHFFTEDKWEEEHQILPYYIGFLSATDEWHALMTGFKYGLSTKYEELPEFLFDEDNPRYSWEVAGQSHYAEKGFVAGNLTPNDRSGWVAIPVGITLWEIGKAFLRVVVGV